MFGGWGRGGGGNSDGSSSRPTADIDGSGGNGGGFLDDPFDQGAATDQPAEWQGGGAWDDEATLEAGASDSGFEGQEGGADDDGGFGGGGGRSRPAAGGQQGLGGLPAGMPGIPGQGLPLPPQQPGEAPRVDPAEVRRRLGMGVCAIEALVHGVQGAVIGSIFGIFGGVSEGMSAGARGKPLVQHVLLRARGSAASFGSWIGVYQGSKCSMMVARGGKKDAFNAFCAGFAAGAVPALPTRNPRVILFSALGSAGLMGSIEAAGAFFGGGGGGGH